MDDDYKNDVDTDDDYMDDDYLPGSGDDDDDDDDYLPGSGDNDDDDDDYVPGFVDDDYVRKLFDGEDSVTGERIRKRHFSDDDYSFLPSNARRLFEGTRRADNLIGRGVDVEVFVGRRRSDNFVFGDRDGAFYTDSLPRRADVNFGVIKDFSFRQKDQIFLSGKPKDYVLSRVRIDGISAVGIHLDTSKGDDLIALIQGKRLSAFDLGDSSVFRFFDG